MRSYIPSLLWRVCSVCCIWFENCACNCYNGKYSSVCKIFVPAKNFCARLLCFKNPPKIIENLSSSSVFLLLANFRQIATYPQDFSWKKNTTQTRQIFKNYFSYRQIFYDKIQQCFFHWPVFAKFRPEKI